MTGARIAFDARYINDRYHGIGRYAFRLLEALIEAAPHHTFLVYTGRHPDGRFDLRSLAHKGHVEFRAGPWPLYWPHEQLIWPRLLRGAEADLFHTPYFVLPLLSSVPAINTVHDLIFDRFPAYMPQAWSRPYYRQLMRRSTGRAARIVAVSRATAGDLTRYYGARPSSISVITEGADPAFRPVSDQDHLANLRSHYGLRRPFILNVGARRPHKNLPRLVEAFAAVAPQFPHQLVFVGPADGRFPDPLAPAVAAAGVAGRVRVLDWVPEDHLPGLYSLADLVVLPSLIEGFGLPALEAMACGVPVIAADNSAFPEVVGHAGRLVNPHDVSQLAEAIRRLLDDPEERRWLAAAGRARAATFTWTAAAQAVLALYNQVLS